MVNENFVMKHRNILFALLVLVATAAGAQVSVRLQAPQQAEVGARIRVSYVVNTTDVEDFDVGDFDGFRVLYGPSTSSSSSFSMVNGKTTKSSSMTFTYTVVPSTEGKLKVPSATVKVDGKSYQSGTATIDVLPASDNSQAQSQHNSQQGGGSQADRPRTSGGNIGPKDLFITVTANKKKIFEQEAVLLTYKLYTLVNVQQIAGDMPQLDGFHVQEIDQKAQMSLKYERYEGRNYGTAVWRQYVLFPQKVGKLKVPSISFDAQVEQTNTSMDPFDIFFGGGSLTQVVRKTIATPALEIEVQPLPTPKPASFSGAVGKFTLTGSLTPSELNANDAATLRLIVSGQGNMKLMQAPKVSFPSDFEIYDPKETDKTSQTSTGARGNKIFDYVVVPRHGGKYSVPPVEFSYFDPEKGTYTTLHTDSFHVSVSKSKGRTAVVTQEQEELKVLNDDIRYIKKRHLTLRNDADHFFGSGSYWAVYAGMTAVFLLLLALFYRRAKENANVSKLRGRKAGKAAGKRLRAAARLMKAHDSKNFFEEVMNALLGYAADKLNLPLAELNKENVSQRLSERGVGSDLVSGFVGVLEECEFARFAPGDSDATMEKIFASASEIINKLDAAIKKS